MSTFVHTLSDAGSRKDELFLIPIGSTVIFRLHPNLKHQNEKVVFEINYPVGAGSVYNRQTYYPLPWDPSARHWDRQAALKFEIPCNYHYRLVLLPTRLILTDGYINLKRILPANQLPLETLSLQTQLVKQLGPLTSWESRLAHFAVEAGFSGVHFTPVQARGSSDSAYSLLERDNLSPGVQADWATLQDFTKTLRHRGINTVHDLVLNHTANETSFLLTHPDAAYNLSNSPHLRPAYLVDRVFQRLSHNVSSGLHERDGVPAKFRTFDHLAALERLARDAICSLRIHEFYMLDLDKVCQEFRVFLASDECVARLSRRLSHSRLRPSTSGCTVSDEPDPLFRRGEARVSSFHEALQCAAAPQSIIPDRLAFDPEYRADLESKFRALLSNLNADVNRQVDSHINAAISNFIANASWRFVDPKGDKFEAVVTGKSPLMWSYFIDHTTPAAMDIHEDEGRAFDPQLSRLVQAHNGWVMCDDPLRNFAEPGSMVYLRRELIPWGDSVKLRYGKCFEDNPFLWDHMRAYVQRTASVFDGARLDNCHSTPIEAAEFLIDCAREVNPDFFVIAELFTNSPRVDIEFVNRLGIDALVRESFADNGRLEKVCHVIDRFSNTKVGHLRDSLNPVEESNSPNHFPPLVSQCPPAILYDVTHDNPSAVERFSPCWLPGMMMLNAFAANSATGSTHGLDQLIPRHINVVTDDRRYTIGCKPNSIASKLVQLRKFANVLHSEVSRDQHGVYVDRRNDDLVAVTLWRGETLQTKLLVAHIPHDDNFGEKNQQRISLEQSILVDAKVCQIALEVFVSSDLSRLSREIRDFRENPEFLNGLAEIEDCADFFDFEMNHSVGDSKLLNFKSDPITGKTEIFTDEAHYFTPGSFVIFDLELFPAVESVNVDLQKFLSTADNFPDLRNLSLNQFSFVLFRHPKEDSVDVGMGAYDLPNFGALPFNGLYGLHSICTSVTSRNDLGHPLCENLRQGDWLMDFHLERLHKFEAQNDVNDCVAVFTTWLRDGVSLVKKLPRFLIPRACIALFLTAIRHVTRCWLTKLSSNTGTAVWSDNSFVGQLGLATLQFLADIPDGRLPNLIANPCQLSIAAGFPHFATGLFRNWGRDTFISLPGLLLRTGQRCEARHILLTYACTVRHGLLPNLLADGAAFARFNARDAVWFWLKALQCYGSEILSEKVYPVEYPSMERASDAVTIAQVIHSVLQSHASGVEFREHNAGPEIDSLMRDQGFSNQIGVDWSTGFVFGGHPLNAGTWMDKMGAGPKTHGYPCTPRDGSAIELVAMCHSTLVWLAHLPEHVYPYKSVSTPSPAKSVTLSQWASLIESSFEPNFYIATKPLGHSLIQIAPTFKDTVGARNAWHDYQVRPNQFVAMVMSPTLFSVDHALAALRTQGRALMGCVGMRTLHPTDQQYRPFYDPDLDSDDPGTAKGASYHQGPEWLWLTGFYLRARMIFADKSGSDDEKSDCRDEVGAVLGRLQASLIDSPVSSLTELTQVDGGFCPASCPGQAWSVASSLEATLDYISFCN